jgi:phage gpG-like protein
LGLNAKLGAMILGLHNGAIGLRAMARGEATSAVADAMAVRGAELLDQTFATETAPDGSAWAKAARDYGHSLLNASGAMRASARCVVVTDDGTQITLLFSIDDEKAPWHQFGTFRGGPTTSALRAQNRKSFRTGEAEGQHIPARPMIFSEGEAPAPWVAALEATGQQALDRWMTEHIKF